VLSSGGAFLFSCTASEQIALTVAVCDERKERHPTVVNGPHQPLGFALLGRCAPAKDLVRAEYFRAGKEVIC